MLVTKELSVAINFHRIPVNGYRQYCWRKLILKVMHYIIALLHKKVLFWNALLLLHYFLSPELGLLFFNNKNKSQFLSTYLFEKVTDILL